MHDDYTGNHRPDDKLEAAWAAYVCERRDLTAKQGDYTYAPRHSADFPREVAR